MENNSKLKDKLNKLIQETVMEEGQHEQDLFSDNNTIPKKERKQNVHW